MALTATMYNLTVELADIDRGVYQSLEMRMARQPSETSEYMLMRLLAYCLEYAEGIALTEGVASGDEPAVLIRDLTGRVTAWIEVGLPAAGRLHRGSKLAGRAAVYTHREIRQVRAALDGQKIHNAEEIPVYAFERRFVEEVAAMIDRRTDLSISVTERELYLGINGGTHATTIAEHRFS
ncbi:MAG: YaeQ family protein [Acidobacteriota bacterium]